MTRTSISEGARPRAWPWLAASLLLSACPSSVPPDLTADAGDGDAQDDAAIPCGTSGVSKGPWVLAIDETHAKVRWEACRPGTDPTVIFSTEAGGAEQTLAAVETPFVVTVSTAAPLNKSAPVDLAGTYYMHEATLSGLAPSSCYAYHLGADSSAKGRFCTARKPGEAFRFMAIGDTNPALGTTAHVLATSLPKNPDFVVHGGDIQYYASTLETWALWFPIMAPMLRQGGFFPSIGNHESETPTEYLEYTLRFFGGAGFDGTPAYYRFESGGVWFFSVDTEESLDPSSPQGVWLTSSIVDATKQPGFRFSIVYFHKPFVTCGDTGDHPADRAQLEPIFLQNQVLLVLQAHMHGYERFVFPGITYVTTAGGGGVINDVNQNTSRAYCASRVASGAFYHATTIDIAAAGPALDGGAPDAGGDGGSTSSAVITGTVIDDQGVVRDTFQIAGL